MAATDSIPLSYDTQRELLFCRVHHVIVPSGTIQRHLMKAHSSLSLTERQDLERAFRDCVVRDRVWDETALTELFGRGLPPHLKLEAGLRCEDCKKVWKQAPQRRHTCDDALQSRGTDIGRMVACTVTRVLRAGPGSSYFMVPEDLVPRNAQDEAEEGAVLARQLEDYERQVCISRRHLNESVEVGPYQSLWDRRVQWREWLHGQSMSQLVRLISLNPNDESDPVWRQRVERIKPVVLASVRRWTRTVEHYTDRAGSGGIMLRKLRGFDSPGSQKPFELLRSQAAQQRYASTLAQVVVCQLRMAGRCAPADEQAVYDLSPLPSELLEILNGLDVCLDDEGLSTLTRATGPDVPADVLEREEVEDEDDDESEEKKEEEDGRSAGGLEAELASSQAFVACASQLDRLLLFLTEQELDGYARRSPVVFALALQAWNTHSSQFRPLNWYSQFLSHLIYVMRLAAFHRVVTDAQGEVDVPQTTKMERYCHEYLSPGRATLFDEIHSQRNLAFEFSSGGYYARPILYWRDSGNVLQVLDVELHIPRLRSMLRSLIESGLGILSTEL